MNPLLDALGDIGYAADTPGAYLRGVLAGRPGARSSGREMLQSWGTIGEDTPGLDFGDVAGFGAEALLDPLSLAGPALGAFKGIRGLTRGAEALSHADDANPLLRSLGRFGADEEGALKLGRAPFTSSDVAVATGRSATQLGFDEAKAAYQPWVDQLLPEEANSVQLFTNGPQARISHALRHASELAGGGVHNPFANVEYGRTLPGTVAINTPEDVMQEVVPYLDSGLSRASAPQDLMTYRLSRRMGDLNPETAESLIGQTVSDPSYMSTTINPWGRFYGNTADPGTMLLDMVVPQGAPGGYADALSRWSKEKELLLPRDAQFRVADARQVPVQKVDYDWHRLDPEGKPIPLAGNYGGGLFRHIPEDEFADVFRQGVAGDTVVPREFMAPDWQAYRDRNLQGQGHQVNVLLEMLGGGLGPHRPAVGRISPQEAVAHVLSQLGPVEARNQNWLNSLRGRMDAIGGRGEYPDEETLRELMRTGSLARTFDMGQLYRSFPR